MNIDISAILNSEPSYSHLNLQNMTLSVDIPKDELEAILEAYDRGFDKMSDDKLQLLNQVIARLKDQIHP